MASSRAAMVVAAYVLAAIVWTAPASLSPTDTLPDVGDPVHLAYVMAWDAHQLVRAPLSLFDSNSFYPYPSSLAFGDHLLPEALMAAPVNWLTGNAALASNLALIASLTLSAFTMFLFARRITGLESAAFVAGFAYAFNSFTRTELLRIHVVNLQWWPLAFFFLDRFVREGGRRNAWGLAASLSLAGLSGSYYLVYTALLAPLWFGIAYAASGRRPSAGDLRALVPPALVCAIPILLLMLPYVRLMATLGFSKGLEPGADVLDYFRPVKFQLLWGAFAAPGPAAHGRHFLGYLTALVALAGLRADTAAARLGRRLALVTAGVGFLFSLGASITFDGAELMPGPYRALYLLFPPARGMAGSSRFGVLVVVGVALLVGLGAARLLGALRPAPRAAVTLLLTVILGADHWKPARAGAPIPPPVEAPAAYSFLAAEGDGPLVDLPLFSDESRRQWSLYLNLSTHHWRPIPFGRTSFYPPPHDYLGWAVRGFPEPAALTLFDRLGIRTLVVHPRAWVDPALREQRLAALEAEPRLHLVRAFTDAPAARYTALRLGEERVYRLDAQPGTEACRPDDEIPRSGWTASSTVGDSDNAIDSDPRTAWRTQTPQRPGDFLEVEFPETQTIAAVALDFAYPYSEFPRDLQLRTRIDSKWERVHYEDGGAARWATVQALLERPREARIVLRMEPRSARAIRLSLGAESDAAWPAWAIPEVRAFRECRVTHPEADRPGTPK